MTSRRSLLRGVGTIAAATLGTGTTVAEAVPEEFGSVHGTLGEESAFVVGVAATADDLVDAVRPHLPRSATVTKVSERLRYVQIELDRTLSESRKATFMQSLAGESDVKYVEPLRRGSADPIRTASALNTRDQYAPELVNAPAAWETTTGSADVRVGVVDQGVKYDHPDLAANMDDAVANFGHDDVDDDGDPYPEDLSEDAHSHGTHVAGIVAAEQDDDGVSGIADVPMTSARVLDTDNRGTFTDIADGIAWQGDNGADVINASIYLDSESPTVENAVKKAYNAGSAIVAIAGNDGESSIVYPGRYSEVFAVSAIDESEAFAGFSNYSTAGNVDACAPGSSVLSTWIDDGYGTMSGTSMAAPVVSGVAALALSEHSFETPADLYEHLRNTAVDVGLSDAKQGAGRIDAKQAVETVPGESPNDGGDGDDGTTEPDSRTVGDWLGEYELQCHRFEQQFDETSKVEFELSGPRSADFDLHVVEGDQCTQWNGGWTSDYSSRSPDSEESIVVEAPYDGNGTVTASVFAWKGYGEYELTVTEYGR